MWIHSDTVGAEVRSLHSPKRDHLAATRVTTDVGAFLRNHANGRAQGTNDGSVSSTHCVLSLLLQTAPTTKLLPVVQLRSGVILLMGDPKSTARTLPTTRPTFCAKINKSGCSSGFKSAAQAFYVFESRPGAATRSRSIFLPVL